MSKRSQWKAPYISFFFFKKLITSLEEKQVIKTRSRSSTVIPALLGRVVKVHTGRAYVVVKIKKEMLGYKLGSFIPTRFFSKVKNGTKSKRK